MSSDLREIAIRTLVPVGVIGGFYLITQVIKRRELRRAQNGNPMKVVYLINGEFTFKEKAKVAFITLTKDAIQLRGDDQLTIPYSKISKTQFYPRAAGYLQTAMVEIFSDTLALKLICIRFTIGGQFIMGNRMGTAAIYSALTERTQSDIKNKTIPAIASTNNKKHFTAQWLWYLGFLASTATMEVLSKNSFHPERAYYALPLVAFFFFKIIQTIFQQVKATDTSNLGNPTSGTKFQIELVQINNYKETLTKWANENNFLKHETSTDSSYVFIKEGTIFMPRYISVTNKAGKILIEAWLQVKKQAIPIKAGQIMPIPHGKLTKELNTLLSLFGKPGI